MRRFITMLTLAAFTAGSVPGGWGLSSAQDVSPEASQRLRDAVDQLRRDQGDTTVGVPDQARLDETNLETLVGPYALYPDSLLAQVLVAATYPDQVAKANALIGETDTMSDEDLAAALKAEDWDPSVLVLLSGFPTVITRMAGDTGATERLGAAMVDQDQDVLAAVQRLRARAEAAGNLFSNEAQTVTHDGDEITIRPARSDVVYVPDYDPDTVYLATRSLDAATPPLPRPAQLPPVTETARPAPQLPAATQTTPAYTTPVQTFQPTQSTGTGLGTAQNAIIAGAVAFGGALLVSQLFGDDDKPDSGWDDYWHRNDTIDWRDRQFYPRSGTYDRRDPWARERDRYWDRNDRRWHPDDAARRYRDEDRRSALRWTGFGEPGGPRLTDKEISDWREKARREKAREERAAALRRDQRREEADQRERRQQAAEAAREKERDAARKREEAAKARDKDRKPKPDAARGQDRPKGKQEAKPSGQDKKPNADKRPNGNKQQASDKNRPNGGDQNGGGKQNNGKQNGGKQNADKKKPAAQPEKAKQGGGQNSQKAKQDNQKPKPASQSKEKAGNSGKKNCAPGDNSKGCKS